MKKKYLIFFTILIMVAATVLTGCTPSSDEPRLELKYPGSYNYHTDQNSIEIRLICQNIDELRLNDRKIYTREMERLCSNQGYEYSLSRGENIFRFKGTKITGNDRDDFTLRFKVTYEP